TALQLGEEKLAGVEPELTQAQEALFEIGHSAEREGRNWCRENLKFEFAPAVLLSTKVPDLLASLDGFVESEGLLFECKYVGRKVLREIKDGTIPAHHLCQVQAQLLVADGNMCVYFATDPDGESAVVEVRPDAAYQDTIGEAVTNFMENIRKGVLPEPSDRDFHTPDDERFKNLFELKRAADEYAAK